MQDKMRPAAARDPSPFPALVRAGASDYRRGQMICRLLPLGPADARSHDDPAVEAAHTRRLCGLLARALRAERRRGRAGHWTYDLNRHLGLLQALAAERRHLRALSSAS